MPRPKATKQRLVSAALHLTHTKGFSNMTLADVAACSCVPLGSVYHHFRTKEALGETIVAELVDEYRRERQRWEQEPDARARLGAWLDMVEGRRPSLAASGCPVGSLCTDLGKTSATLRTRAEVIFSELLDFAEAQFCELGMGSASRDLAVHLLSALQGAAVIAHAFNDERIVEREIAGLRRWLDSIGNRAASGVS